MYAISIKQPWAALVVHGFKRIEIRSWSTNRRGRILIHAARVSDDRKYGWSLVPQSIQETAKLVGGILGAVELIDCKTYQTQEAFDTDRIDHLNDPSWFVPPAMYGFVFANGERLPFQPMAGSVRFFPVPADLLNRKETKTNANGDSSTPSRMEYRDDLFRM